MHRPGHGQRGVEPHRLRQRLLGPGQVSVQQLILAEPLERWRVGRIQRDSASQRRSAVLPAPLGIEQVARRGVRRRQRRVDRQRPLRRALGIGLQRSRVPFAIQRQYCQRLGQFCPRHRVLRVDGHRLPQLSDGASQVPVSAARQLVMRAQVSVVGIRLRLVRSHAERGIDPGTEVLAHRIGHGAGDVPLHVEHFVGRAVEDLRPRGQPVGGVHQSDRHMHVGSLSLDRAFQGVCHAKAFRELRERQAGALRFLRRRT